MIVKLTTLDGKRRKHFTTMQRLEILREWESTGSSVTVVSEQYGVHPRTLYRWKNGLRPRGETDLEGSLLKLSLQVEALQRENQILTDTVISQSKDLMFFKKRLGLG